MDVPLVKLSDLMLEPLSGIASERYWTSIEQIAVAFTRHRCLVVDVATPIDTTILTDCAFIGSVPMEEAPGSRSITYRLGGPHSFPGRVWQDPHAQLELVARTVLTALCRSSLLRLRGDALSHLLDDLPLMAQQLGSSIITLREFVDNFSRLSSRTASTSAPLFADPQQAVTERSLLSVMVCQEAEAHGGAAATSVLQVQAATGDWQSIELGESQVAVVAGRTLSHLTAGLVPPGVHRVAGEPLGGARRRPRRVAHFELLPRPSAVLDCAALLQDAGHPVPARYATPVLARDLLQQLESTSATPGKAPVGTPQLHESAAAHAAWLQATAKKSKRRSEGREAQQGQHAVGRSGRTRRSAGGGAARQQHGDKENVAGAGAGAGGSGAAAPAAVAGAGARRPGGGSGTVRRRPSELFAGVEAGGEGGGGTAALYHTRGKLCVLMESVLEQPPAECLVLTIRAFTGIKKHFYLHRETRLGECFESWAGRSGVALGSVKFLHQGERVFGASTPAELGLGDCTELTAVPEASDRLLALRELGPLFAATCGDVTGAVARDDDGPLEL